MELTVNDARTRRKFTRRILQAETLELSSRGWSEATPPVCGDRISQPVGLLVAFGALSNQVMHPGSTLKVGSGQSDRRG